MLPWFAPVLAQLITLEVQDRNEARYVAAVDHRYEAATRPGGMLRLRWPKYDLALGYNVALLETPLERKPREFLAFSTATLDTAYRIERVTLSLNSFASWGEVNLAVAALQNPNPPTPTNADATTGGSMPNQPQTPNAGIPDATTGTGNPGTGTTTSTATQGTSQTRAVNQTVRYQTSLTTLRVTDQPTRQLRLSTFAKYAAAGGLNDASVTYYPVTRGTSIGADATHNWRFTRRDLFATSSVGQHTWSSNGNRATSLISKELWTHRFDRQFSTIVGGGLSLTRISQTDGLIAYSVFPDFSAGINYSTRVGRGQFSWQTTAYSTPVLDPLRATVDPQVGVRGNIRFAQDRFASWLTGNVGVSVASAQANAGAFDSYQALFINSFRLSDWAEIDAGARVVQLQYRGGVLVPFSYAGFVGLEFGYLVPLQGHVKR